MPIYIGDYLKDTQDLSDKEHGVYLLLLMHYWQKKGKIGDDIERLARVAKTDVKTCRFILGSFWVLENGNYINKRADIEMQNAISRREAAQKNGQKGGRPPKNDENNPEKTHRFLVGKPRKNQQGNPEKTSSSSSSSSKTYTQSEENNRAPSAAASQLVQVSEDESELYHKVKTVFEREQPGHRFTDYGKEGRAIKGLITKARARSPDKPDAFLSGMIGQFQALRKNGDKFWRGQPFLPSALNASGIFDRVLSAAQQHYEDTKQAAENWEEIEF
jgi:uncharacterized protein YdaU (DUF1376 family)